MFTFISGDWHFWQTFGSTAFLASDESKKRLLSFKSIDDCINWLFLNGHKNEARALNKAKK